MGIRILLADDHQILREGLRSLLERQEGMEVCAEAENGRDAVRLARELSPDVAVLDVVMPELNGIEAARQILEHLPRTKVIGLSMHSRRQHIAAMLQAGARAYVLKDSAFDELVRAIEAVTQGQAYLSAGITSIVVADYLDRLEKRDEPPLSNREMEVLQLLAEGLTNRETAARLHISVKTVESHRSQIMKKLGISSIAELTKYAVREGISPLEP
jgi:DNA-binding NarL/FixJ family response regulator